MSKELLPKLLPTLLGESRDWIAVAKPSGWLSVEPSPGAAYAPVVVSWLKERFASLFIVHRLDLQTSGVLLFARTPTAHRQAGIWFQNHEVKKLYDFLAEGTPSFPMFRVDEPIQGAPSRTQFELKAAKCGVFLGQAVPRTGRRHQIRIHLAHSGYPILGDEAYGGKRTVNLPSGESVAIERVALHARKLELPSGESFEAPWPEDMIKWCSLLGVKQ